MTNYGGITGDQLRQFIERIERLEEEKAAIATDIREIFAEAKAKFAKAKCAKTKCAKAKCATLNLVTLNLLQPTLRN